MAGEPVVSVVMATYNRAHVLPAAINSVMVQTLPDWELVIRDDGSTDRTREVVESYADQRIVYSHQDNRGKSCAINGAIDASRGGYIAFLDDDDVWDAKKLATQVEVMDANPRIGLLFCNFVVLDSSGDEGQLGFDLCAGAIGKLDVERRGGGLSLIRSRLPESITAGNYILPSSVLVRRAIFDSVGCFREDLRNSEDFEMWWRMSLSGVSFAFLDDVLVTRRKLLGSLSSAGLSTYENKIRSLDYCAGEARSKGLEDLVLHLRPAYRRAWQNMITQHGLRRGRKRALAAFFQSMKYGFSSGSARLLLEALTGQNLRRRVRSGQRPA